MRAPKPSCHSEPTCPFTGRGLKVIESAPKCTCHSGPGLVSTYTSPGFVGTGSPGCVCLCALSLLPRPCDISAVAPSMHCAYDHHPLTACRAHLVLCAHRRVPTRRRPKHGTHVHRLPHPPRLFNLGDEAEEPSTGLELLGTRAIEGRVGRVRSVCCMCCSSSSMEKKFNLHRTVTCSQP